MDSCKGPWEAEVECTEDRLVVDGEGEIEQEVHGQPCVGCVNLCLWRTVCELQGNGTVFYKHGLLDDGDEGC